jgi:hypothetical protein
MRDIPGYEGYKINENGEVFGKRFGKKLKYGYDKKNGYNKVKIFYNGKHKTLKIHKLMQLAFNMGEGHIDHINRDRLDNRLTNLRVVTQRQNCQNRITNDNGLPVGVEKRGKTFKASICIHSKNKYLGTYKTPEEAHEAYLNKLKELKEDYVETIASTL